MFKTYSRFSYKIFGRPFNEWELLMNMQHYGIPTRLLDWTDNFGTALYFAAYWNNLKEYDCDAVIYVLDPEGLNISNGVKTDVIGNLDEDEKFSYEDIYLNGNKYDKKEIDFPIAIEPRLTNERIFAQRGNFTIHDKNDPSIDTGNEYIKKVRLKNEAIHAAIEFLDLANINEYTVYPDIRGISEFINNNSGLVHWKELEKLKNEYDEWNIEIEYDKSLEWVLKSKNKTNGNLISLHNNEVFDLLRNFRNKMKKLK